MNQEESRIIFALDVPDADQALPFIEGLTGKVSHFKVGLELFSGADGPRVVQFIRSAGGRVFADLKLHDIPETVRRAAKNAAASGASLITAHALGGTKMLAAAVEGAQEGNPDAKILAITILTSHTLDDLRDIGLVSMVDLARFGDTNWLLRSVVQRLGQLAEEAGCQGVVASPREVAYLRHVLGPEMLIVTPGIRAAGAETQDQARAGTAYQAIRDGATKLVIGRPIRDAPDPVAAVQAFEAECLKAQTDPS